MASEWSYATLGPEQLELVELAERNRKTEEQRQAILNPKKPWWKIW